MSSIRKMVNVYFLIIKYNQWKTETPIIFDFCPFSETVIVFKIFMTPMIVFPNAFYWCNSPHAKLDKH